MSAAVVPGTFPRNEEHAEEVRSPFLTPTVRNEEHSGERLFLDVAALLDGGLPEPPAPVVCERDDGRSLFYAGQVNLIFGDPESGKTLLAQASCAEALKAGRRVLCLDLDHNGPASFLARLLMFGAPMAALRDRQMFRYVEPEDRQHLNEIMSAAVEWRPALAVVDSVGELLPILGLSSNSPDDFTVAHAHVLKPLARAGACVLAIDHLAKNAESRASGPTGTAAKRRAIGGVSMRVSLKDPFTPGRGGRAALTVHKDRHGGLRQHCPAPDGGEAYAGTFVMEEVDGRIRWHVTTPKDGDTAPAQIAALDLAALQALNPPPTSVRDVKTRLGWGGNRATEGLRVYRSSFPTQGGRNGEQDCTVCGFALDAGLSAAGDTTHPMCETG